MIEETAVVKCVEGSYIWISPATVGGACKGCKSSASCSTNLLTTLLQGKQTKTVRIDNNLNAKVNDQIVVGIHPQGLLSGSALIYLLPLLLLFFLALLAGQLFGEAGSILAGIIGLVLGLWISKQIAGSNLMKSKLKLSGLRKL